jgi:hypothetical protein
MCKHCDHILVGYTIRHTEDACPLKRSQYCASCAKRGHTKSTCPKAPAKQTQFPVHLPPNNEHEQEENTNLVELKNVDCVLREYLKNHGHEGPLKKRQLRGCLANYAEENDLTINLINA